MKNNSLTQFAFLVFGILAICTSAFSQDTIFTYDIATMNLTWRLMPTYNVNSVSDSTDPSFGIYGVTVMPTSIPLNTYPGTGVSLLDKASNYYSNLNFPFSALSLIKYGDHITAAVIGRKTLLAFKFDVYNPNPPYYRNLSDANPFFDNGMIQYGHSKLTPVRYYFINSPNQFFLYNYFSVIEVAENIGDSSGYFGLAFDTTPQAYDSMLLFNPSYPNEGYPLRYSSPVNGDTLCFKYGFISNPDDFVFHAYWGGDGEYSSPYFDDHFRIHGLRWSYGDNYKIGQKGFYFIKYVVDSLADHVPEIENETIRLVYPNPAFDKVTIQLSSPLKSNEIILITNVLGQTIQTLQFHSGETAVSADISDLQKGLYFLISKSKMPAMTGKFVKE